jgi:hypothetical protein
MPEAVDAQQPMHVGRGEPFNVLPDLTRVPSTLSPDDGLTLLSRTAVEIEGVGTAEVRFMLEPSFTDGGGFETPAGPIPVSTVIDNGQIRYDAHSLPITVSVMVKSPYPDKLDSVSCMLTFGDHSYQGNVEVEDVETNQNPSGPTPAACVDAWMIGDEAGSVFFPQNPDVLKDIKLTIS